LGGGLMAKKVKSFTLEEEPYEALLKIFRENYVDVSISYFLNKAIKELLLYFQSIQEEIKQSPDINVPMSYVIETAVREPLYRSFDSSAIQKEVKEFQRKYEIHIKKNPEKISEYNVEMIDDNVSLAKVVQYVTKAFAKQLRERRELTEDEYVELIREAGGKGLDKKIAEKIYPAMQKIDPDLKDVIAKIKKGKKNKGN
jgi:hypothetical protein